MRELRGGVCEFPTAPERLADGIYRICIPFDGNIYTTSFVLLGDGGAAVLDSGSCDADAETYILPFLESLGCVPEYVIGSHRHEDHCGGTAALLARFPSAKAVIFAENSPYRDGDVLLGRYRLLNLPGHTPDSLAVFDERTRILLTCDCLQQRGITRFPTGVSDVPAYLETLRRVRELGVSTVIAAHNYDPLGWRADGEAAIERLLEVCAKEVR